MKRRIALLVGATLFTQVLLWPVQEMGKMVQTAAHESVVIHKDMYGYILHVRLRPEIPVNEIRVTMYAGSDTASVSYTTTGERTVMNVQGRTK